MRAIGSWKYLLVLALLGLALTLAGFGCSSEASDENENGQAPTAALLVQPVTSTVGSTIAVYASGLPPGAKVQLLVDTEDGIVGLAGLVTPIPSPNDYGAFAGSLKPTGLEAGAYTVQLVVNDEVVATAPMELTSPS